MLTKTKVVIDPNTFYAKPRYFRDGILLKSAFECIYYQDLRRGWPELFIEIKDNIEEETTYYLDQEEADWIIKELDINAQRKVKLRYSAEFQCFY